MAWNEDYTAWNQDDTAKIIGFQTARLDLRQVRARSEQKDCRLVRPDEHTKVKINLMRKSSGNRQETSDRPRHRWSIGKIDCAS